jgi:hypothetical protein
MSDDFSPQRDIPFTQYLRPHGRPRKVWIERPPDIIAKAHAIMAAGGRFEIEELSDRTVSATVEHAAWERDNRGPVAIELAPNGPHVPLMVDRLVTAAYTILIKP